MISPSNCRIVLVSVILLFSIFVSAQDLNWIKQTWGKYRVNMAVDDDGSVYVHGDYYSTGNTVDGVALDSSGTEHLFTAKYNAQGQLLWASTVSGDNNSNFSPSAVCCDQSGNVYITGYFSNYMQFDNLILQSSGNSNGYIAKYNSEGTLLWAKLFKSEGSYLYDIKTDAFQNCFVTGTFQNQIVYNDSVVGVPSNSDEHFMLMKIDTDGNLKWLKTGSGFGLSVPKLSVFPDGQISLAVEFQMFIKWEQDSIQTLGGVDLFMLNLNQNGDTKKVITIGGPTYELLKDLKTDNSGNTYLMGMTSDSLLINDSLWSYSDEFRNFVIKTDSQGKTVWCTTYYSDTSQFIIDKLLVDHANRVFSYGDETEIVTPENYLNYTHFGLIRHTFDTLTGTISDIKKFGNFPDPAIIATDLLGNLYFQGPFRYFIQFGNTLFSCPDCENGKYIARLGFFENDTTHMPSDEFLLYPNPVHEILQLHLNDKFTLPVSIDVYDIHGQLINTYVFSSYYPTVNTSCLSNGVYLIHIQDGKTSKSCEFIKY